MNGFAFRACGGTPKIWAERSQFIRVDRTEADPTYVRENLLGQLSPFCLVKRFVEAEQPPTSLQAISGHLELVHCVHVLDVHFDTWAVGCLRSPHV